MELEAPTEVVWHLKASILSSREKIWVKFPVVSMARFVPLFSVWAKDVLLSQIQAHILRWQALSPSWPSLNHQQILSNLHIWCLRPLDHRSACCTYFSRLSNQHVAQRYLIWTLTPPVLPYRRLAFPLFSSLSLGFRLCLVRLWRQLQLHGWRMPSFIACLDAEHIEIFAQRVWSLLVRCIVPLLTVSRHLLVLQAWRK